jgi:hypothetical protein
MFWFLDKQSNTAEIFGSITSLCERTGLKSEALYYQFSRMKKLEFEDDRFRIVKCVVQRTKR